MRPSFVEVTELERVKYLPKFAVDRIVYYSAPIYLPAGVVAGT